MRGKFAFSVLLSSILSVLACQPTRAEASEGTLAHGPDPGTPQSVPLRIYRDFLLIAEGQFGANLPRQNVVLDTGTAPTIINAKLASQLGLATTSSVMTTVGRIAPTQFAVLPELELGPVRAVSLRVQVQDLSRLERDIGMPVAAIIGLDVLSKLSFRLDYDKKRIDFGEVSDEGIPIAVNLRAGIAVARVKINGRSARLLIDTGSDRVALIGRNPSEISELGLRGITSQQGVSLTDHNMPVQVVLAPDISFAGHHFAAKKAYFIFGTADPSFDGLLGVRALGFRAVAYDQRRATLYLQK